MATKIERVHIASYMNEKAPVLFFSLDKDGQISRMNTFAVDTIGAQLIGKAFQDIVLDFQRTFQLSNIIDASEKSHLLNIKTAEGHSQTYLFHFYAAGENILAFGHLDVIEIENLSEALVSANQDLNNLTRELNMKNRELTRANAQITQMSRTDPLTGLANRRYFSERINEMISLSNRNAHPLSLIMTDIDHFKRVNDTFGHDAGDIVLKGYAELMKSQCRAEDLVARFGGEEFIILLPLTDIKNAHVVSERIRKALSQKDFIGNKYVLTASFGVSQFIRDEGAENCIKRADSALYKAKNSGRNRTVLADMATPQSPG